MKQILAFIKKETVFSAAFLCALISAFFVHPDAHYASYIDWNTIFILFSLMAVVASLRKCGLFDALGARLCSAVGSLRTLSAFLIALCFFSSMLITNDVALLTFVPFALLLLRDSPQKTAMKVVIFQTIAANTGSMLTPIGNPQNLYLFQKMGASVLHFILCLLPYTLASIALLALSLFFIPNTKINVASICQGGARHVKISKIIPSALLFVLCLLSVMRLVPKSISALVVGVFFLVTDRNVLRRVDYMLLLTFGAFFVFTGNLSRLDAVKTALEGAVRGNEIVSAVISSQVISNVPAALLLSPFAQSLEKLLVGVNIGGLGTLVASLASLISYKIFCTDKKNQPKGAYLGWFSLANFAFLALLLALSHLIA